MNKKFKTILLATLGLVFISTSSACDNPPTNQNGFTMTAQVLAINDKIEVQILSDEYNEGVMWVNFSSSTPVYDKDGKAISVKDLNVGDKIEIIYSGQVMMSYPAQITAQKITII